MTFSCCMIVKNESELLARCLDSIAMAMDEIIIVDTGSTDDTKEIARRYTDLVFDFPWDDDFSAARNFSFSKATMDYIYAPDADEYLDEYNLKQLRMLKGRLTEDIEIVQMMYNTVSEDTVLNIKNEYRPKLFKRLRTFTWVDPIHETVRLTPVVFNSSIVITHAPKGNHSQRDFKIFRKAIERDGFLSNTVCVMYATELIKCGKKEDLEDSRSYFLNLYETVEDEAKKAMAACVLTRLHRLNHDLDAIGEVISFIPDDKEISEIYYDLGCYYLDEENLEEAIAWFSQAATAPHLLDVHTSGDLALKALSDCYKILGDIEMSEQYLALANNWTMPLEDDHQ